MSILNAVIKSTFLGIEDHGILTYFLNLEHERGNQAFGGYRLSEDHIKSILKVLDVPSWEMLPNKIIRIDAEDHLIKSIGHPLKDDWFNPSK